MKAGLSLMAAALCLSGCVGTDVMSSVAPSAAGKATPFGYPKIEQTALPPLPSVPAVPTQAAPAARAVAAPKTPEIITAPMTTASLPVASQPVAPASRQTVYDESRDPAFTELLASVNKSEAMPDLPMKSDGSMKLPPAPKLDIINVDDARASLQGE